MQFLLTIIIIGVGFWVLTHLFDILASVMTLFVFLLVWLWDNIITLPFKLIGMLFGSSKSNNAAPDENTIKTASDLLEKCTNAFAAGDLQDALAFAEQAANLKSLAAMELCAIINLAIAKSDDDPKSIETRIRKATDRLKQYEAAAGEPSPNLATINAEIEYAKGRLAERRENYEAAFEHYLRADEQGCPVAAYSAVSLAVTAFDDPDDLDRADLLLKQYRQNGRINEKQYEELNAILFFKTIVDLDNAGIL